MSCVVAKAEFSFQRRLLFVRTDGLQPFCSIVSSLSDCVRLLAEWPTCDSHWCRMAKRSTVETFKCRVTRSILTNDRRDNSAMIHRCWLEGLFFELDATVALATATTSFKTFLYYEAQSVAYLDLVRDHMFPQNSCWCFALSSRGGRDVKDVDVYRRHMLYRTCGCEPTLSVPQTRGVQAMGNTKHAL